MEKWEYKWVFGSGSGKWSPPLASVADLNELGAQGWEAVGLSSDAAGTKVLMKRRLPH